MTIKTGVKLGWRWGVWFADGSLFTGDDEQLARLVASAAEAAGYVVRKIERFDNRGYGGGLLNQQPRD